MSVNRNMQAKMMKANRQRAAYALDVADRQAYRDTSAIESVCLDVIVAEYRARKEAERAARATVMENIRAGLGQSVRVGLKARWRA